MPLTRRDRLRRVTLLCCHFTRNLAYYRVANPGEPRTPNRSFWVTVDGNFLDQCVLDWCKLLDDERAQHYWAKIVSDKTRFERELLARLSWTPRLSRRIGTRCASTGISLSRIWMSCA
jgi:hypothetical protein